MTAQQRRELGLLRKDPVDLQRDTIMQVGTSPSGNLLRPQITTDGLKSSPVLGHSLYVQFLRVDLFCFRICR